MSLACMLSLGLPKQVALASSEPTQAFFSWGESPSKEECAGVAFTPPTEQPALLEECQGESKCSHPATSGPALHA